MFIRNAWYVAAWGDEIGETPLARRICNEPVVLFRDREGRVAALVDMCCHRGAPLHMGRVVEEGLQCGYHGLVFDRGVARALMPLHRNACCRRIGRSVVYSGGNHDVGCTGATNDAGY
jgi:phenylpropionate dioxygenase-like ring-hydroxylating dioxygenase large terminal subunit